MGAGASASSHSVITSPKRKPSVGGVAAREFTAVPGLNLDSYSSLKKIRLDPEALTLLDESGDMIALFRYPKIMCWGHSPSTFQFRVLHDDGKLLTYATGTSHGSVICDELLSAVKALMSQMESHKATVAGFEGLIDSVKETESISPIAQFTAMHKLTADQAVELMSVVGELCPFEKMEVACTLYDALINRDSFQQVVNCFPVEVDRENLLHRLGISGDGSLLTTASISGGKEVGGSE